jgi:threonine aldolase
MIPIDLRSDTFTLPCDAMRDAMFNAKLGDDVFGEDPTVNLLQERAAELFGMESALFCSSGTQTNQIAIRVHTTLGGEVICHEESHIYKYEGGGIAVNSGASVKLLPGDRGRLTASVIEQAIQPDDIHFPVSQLISLEDTANRGGGAVYDYTEIEKIAQLSRTKKLPLHLDGARLMNTLVYTRMHPRMYAQAFDSISLCLSKGLGAPIGSLLLGSSEFIQKARRVRKVMGGGMRQAGFLAAAGIYALEHNVERLSIDHFHAKLIEETLNLLHWVKEVLPVQTNIVVCILNEFGKRDQIIQQLAENNVKVVAFGPGMIRFVTHLNISESMVFYALDQLKKVQ